MNREPRIARDVVVDKALRRALGVWQGAVLRMSSVDPTTTELVRLRCAEVHDCAL